MFVEIIFQLQVGVVFGVGYIGIVPIVRSTTTVAKFSSP